MVKIYIISAGERTSILFLFQIIACKNGVTCRVVNSLVADFALPHRTFILHTSFLHHLSGIGIIDIMEGLDTVCAHLFKEKAY